MDNANNAIIPVLAPAPATLFTPTPKAEKRLLEFFTAQINNDHTRKAYLNVTRTTLSELVNGKCGISPEMAVRLSKVFGGSTESWLVQQVQYDLAQVRSERIKLKRLDFA